VEGVAVAWCSRSARQPACEQLKRKAYHDSREEGADGLASQAFSQVITLVAPFARIPYTVDSAFVRYAKDGSSVVSMYATSYNHNSREIVLSSSMPGHPFATAIRRTLDATGSVLFHLTMPFRVTAGQRERAATSELVRNNCVSDARPLTIVGQETILGFTTIATRSLDTDTRTIYLAPALGCFPLKVTVERLFPDGSIRTVVERDAVKVTSNL